MHPDIDPHRLTTQLNGINRRTLLALLATPAFISAMSALQSCASDPSGSSVPSTTTGTQQPTGPARSDKPRLATSVGDSATAAKAINDFGVDLYNMLTAQPPNASPNLVVAPVSIAIALAMTRAGARGVTAAEMDTVLHIPFDAQGGLDHSMNALSAAVESRTRTVERPENEPVDITLSIANSLWGQKGLAFETAFLDVLASEYGAGLQLVDYKSDPNGARKLINAWVDDATKSRIPELLADGVISPATRLTLVNAIYMKAPWLYKFDKKFTADAAFTTEPGTTVQSPFMHLEHDLNYARGTGWQVLELPYIGDDLSMLVGLPDSDGTLAETVAALSSVGSLATTRQVTLSMPSFDIETAVGLGDVLSAMGMPKAFSDSADFSGMTLDEQLFIGAVIHQANITVDEEGTEAAAATAVVMMATSAPLPQEPVELVLDRPFVFAIRDNPTGTLLFVGHIADPTQTRG